jgi:hypothetical protein
MDTVARRNSNFASASQQSYNDGHSNGSDQDEDGDDDKEDAESADISVSLDDDDLECLDNLKNDSKVSQGGLNTRILTLISASERKNKRKLNESKTNEIAETNEEQEYESLVFG